MEEIGVTNFKNRIEQTKAKQVSYLSGISNAEELSTHLSSSKNVETTLYNSNFAAELKLTYQ